MIILLFIILILGFTYQEQKKWNVPKKIWTFHSEKMTNTIKRCISGWRKHHPTYEIIILTKLNIQLVRQYPSILQRGQFKLLVNQL